MPLQQVKQMTSATEYIGWMIYLNEDPNKFNALYMYLAQIAAEVRRSFVKRPNKVEISDFVIKFVNKKTSNKQSVEHSKRAWFSFLRFKRKK